MYYNSDDDTLFIGKLARDIIGGIVILTIILGSFGTISAGYKGVTTRFSAVTGEIKYQGLFFKLPMIDSIKKFSVQIQKVEAEKVYASSKDLQTVTSHIILNFHLDPVKVIDIYRNIGTNNLDYIFNTIISPSLQENIKSVTSRYTAEELVTERQKVASETEIALSQKLLPYGIIVDAINVINFDFSEEFNRSIEQKVTAEQNALTAKNKLEQVKFEAQQRVAQATAEAEAIRIQAEAITQQGGENYVQLKAVEKWNGTLPAQMIPNATLPFINLK